MKSLLLITFLTISTMSFANNPNNCKVKLVLNTTVYADCDFRSQSITYLKKGETVTVTGYAKGFYTIKIGDKTAYITEANIKVNEKFEIFKSIIFEELSKTTESTDQENS